MIREAFVSFALLFTTPHVVDGDTVKVGGISIRLVDYDAPELYHPHCAAEYVLAHKAATELRRLARRISLTLVPCATRNYGRLCARAFLGAVPLAEHMIRMGLAAPYECERGCPPKRNWCSTQ